MRPLGGESVEKVELRLFKQLGLVLGAKVHWCLCNIFSAEYHGAAAIACNSAAVFAWKRPEGKLLGILVVHRARLGLGSWRWTRSDSGRWR
ncbi:hypothetical protein O6H91_19G018300 [Diphasiastrum complanatum]|uniref:Uncharacterized protein n=1 Tax=Diphasiastrum complanatum TaxID=34168 RepID=A0ACC2AT32_DIPCM|nr:hypothetical protein O6H91_19G018300 [Diphasiastrum complanatum]